jgi:manganese transport protein
VKVFQIALGVLAAIGGFVDIGDLVFNSQAGATFGYQLVWAVLVGALGIIVYSEMCGRVAMVAKRPVFEIVRDRMGYGSGLATLVAGQVVNLFTCIAEIGGIAYILRYLTGYEVRPMLALGFIGLVLVLWFFPFEGLERVFGFGGLLLLVFAYAVITGPTDWGALVHGAVPSAPQPAHGGWLIWAYFVVGVASASLMPYEVYFFSSGAVEDGWAPETEHRLNRLTSIAGFALGAFLAISIMIASALVFLPTGVDPQFLGSVPLAVEQPLGEGALVIALLGMLFAIGGAAVDATLSGAYSMAQFFGWEWGKYRKPAEAPRFTLTWFVFTVIAALVVATGIDPIMITEYSVIFGVVAMPLTYLPVLAIANDEGFMGRYKNGRVSETLGWMYFAIIIVLSLTAVPLLILTNMGSG